MSEYEEFYQKKFSDKLFLSQLSELIKYFFNIVLIIVLFVLADTPQINPKIYFRPSRA